MHLYYELDEPTISDAEFDELMRELQDLELQYPEAVTDDSPSRRVGSASSATFAPVTHRVPMTSLDNAMNAAELEAWGERIT